MLSYIPVIWALLIAVAVGLYVVLDGFDLGLGLLFPFFRDKRDRDVMMNSVAPVWDGNETWLVLGGGGLLVAFPGAYAVIMPALYIPVIVMLIALVFRGIAFEFRSISHSKVGWSFAFTLGSGLAAFAQGVILGNLIEGVAVANNAVAGGPFEWARPFPLLCGFAIMAGYALLGATWLAMKTEGPVGRRGREHAKVLLAVVLIFMAGVSVWTPLMQPRIAERWFSLPNILWLWPVPLLTALTAFLAWRWLEHERDAPPFIASIALFLFGYLGLVISNFPYIVPPALTIWDTAAVPASQIFMLFGTLVLLPIILG